MKRVSATARVRLTLEIPSGGAWGADCDMAQIHKQAVEGVLGRLQRADRDLAMLLATGHAQILDSKVTAILVTEGDE